jgi:hypothetical protein
LGNEYINNSYDIDSPYCFPVDFRDTSGRQIGYQISKGGGGIGSAADDEVPDFGKYADMMPDEYKIRE